VFEDAPPGVAAGRAAGAHVVAITTTHSAHQLQEADVVITSLSGITVHPDGTGFLVEV
jgi:mannitol-1-/sugar-/sorbitol-6-phosphatase